LVGVVDWEQALISDPRSDVGQLVALSHLRGAAPYGPPEAVKPGETSFGYLVCMRASGVGWLIQATVGSLGGVGGQANRAGWAA
jgi:hypothetical protein